MASNKEDRMDEVSDLFLIRILESRGEVQDTYTKDTPNAESESLGCESTFK